MSLKTLPQECNFYLYDVPNHADVKAKILDAIKSMGTHSLIEQNQQISNSDWHLGRELRRPYLQEIQGVLDVHTSVVNTHCVPAGISLAIQNYWFQQYDTGDYHDWHMHRGTTLSNVYYVELPDGASKTTFKVGERTFEVEVKEGQILTFPSCMAHSSKPNKGDTKTIIAFNY